MIQLIGPQKPRDFSISNSLLIYPDSIHLTMGVLRYKTVGHKRLKEGIWSSYISKLPISTDSKVLCYIKSGTFLIPQDLQVPIILVAAGTGIAPFRNIIQDRIARIKQCEEYKSDDHNIILFYGWRNPKDDDYYSKEWEIYDSYLKVIKAYSRVTDSKIYVQHKIRENADIWRKYLIEKDAMVFVAGQSKFMPKSVHKAFVEILSEVEGIDAEKLVKSRCIVEAW